MNDEVETRVLEDAAQQEALKDNIVANAIRLKKQRKRVKPKRPIAVIKEAGLPSVVANITGISYGQQALSGLPTKYAGPPMTSNNGSSEKRVRERQRLAKAASFSARDLLSCGIGLCVNGAAPQGLPASDLLLAGGSVLVKASGNKVEAAKKAPGVLRKLWDGVDSTFRTPIQIKPPASQDTRKLTRSTTGIIANRPYKNKLEVPQSTPNSGIEAPIKTPAYPTRATTTNTVESQTAKTVGSKGQDAAVYTRTPSPDKNVRQKGPGVKEPTVEPVAGPFSYEDLQLFPESLHSPLRTAALTNNEITALKARAAQIYGANLSPEQRQGVLRQFNDEVLSALQARSSNAPIQLSPWAPPSAPAPTPGAAPAGSSKLKTALKWGAITGANVGTTAGVNTYYYNKPDRDAMARGDLPSYDINTIENAYPIDQNVLNFWDTYLGEKALKRLSAVSNDDERARIRTQDRQLLELLSRAAALSGLKHGRQNPYFNKSNLRNVLMTSYPGIDTNPYDSHLQFSLGSDERGRVDPRWLNGVIAHSKFLPHYIKAETTPQWGSPQQNARVNDWITALAKDESVDPVEMRERLLSLDKERPGMLGGIARLNNYLQWLHSEGKKFGIEDPQTIVDNQRILSTAIREAVRPGIARSRY